MSKPVTIGLAPGHHPLVVWADEEIRAQMTADESLTIKTICKEAGVAERTIANWRNGHMPNVGNLDAVLRALGYKLAIVEAS